MDVVPSVEAPPAQADDIAMKAALTPPTSEDNDKRDERMSSELSEIDSDDGEDIEPDHYFEGGKIPVFKPVCISNTCYKINAMARNLRLHCEACIMYVQADPRAVRLWTSFATSRDSSTRSTGTE